MKRARARPKTDWATFRENQIRIKYQSECSDERHWGSESKLLHDSLKQVYHATRNNNTRQIWENKGYEHSTESGQTKCLELTQDRKIHEITQIGKKIEKRQKRITKRTTPNAWERARVSLLEYTQNTTRDRTNRKSNTWAKRKEIYIHT